MLLASWRELSAQERHLLYGYGCPIAKGIGTDGLRELDRVEIEQRATAIIRSATPASVRR